MSASVPRLGWIGLGSMGLGMATNLQNHLVSLGASNLIYTNRTISRGAPLAALGATPASIPDLVAQTDMIFLSLGDDAALEATLDAVLAGPDLTSKTFVDTSTVHPDTSARARDRLASKSALFVASPVFGASPVAAEGKLLFVVAGPAPAVEAMTPFVTGVMGRAIIPLGEDVKLASLMKTTGNFITAGFMQVIAESLVLAEKSGLGAAAAETLIEMQYGPLALSMARRMTSGAYMPPAGARPMSDLKLALKDVGHGAACAAGAGTRLEVADVVLAHLREADEVSDSLGRAMDSSSLYGAARRRAGLDFESDVVKARDAPTKQEDSQ